MNLKRVFIALFVLISIFCSSALCFTIKEEQKSLEFSKLNGFHKNRIQKIIDKFGDNVNINISIVHPERLLVYPDATIPLRKIRPLINEAKMMDINGNNSIKKYTAIKKWENIGRIVCAEAGYPVKSLFSLKVDTFHTGRDIDLRIYKKDEKEGTLSASIALEEYYNDIPVSFCHAIVVLRNEYVSVINFQSAGITGAKVEATKPKYSADDALQMYLNKTKIVLWQDSQGKLRYFYNVKTNTLSLCWYFSLSANKPRYIWINSITRQIENDVSAVKN
jgi:hypothetical protein